MASLFTSFEADSHLLLIFLKSVESVELYTRYGSNKTILYWGFSGKKLGWGYNSLPHWGGGDPS